MNVFLVRHGQTLLNHSNAHQYSITPLSEIGFHEAERIAEHLKETKIGVIYSSPLLRAKQTAEAISRVSKKKVVLLNELKEAKKPSVVEGKSHDDPAIQQIKQGIKDNFSCKNWHHSDEENFWDIQRRISRLMKLVEGKREDNILFVSHGIVIKMFLSLCIFKEKLTAPEFLAFYEHIHISNTGITHCRYSTKSGWKVMRVNDTTHLIDS